MKANNDASHSKRNPNIDFLKGMLILLVIVGHLLNGSIRSSLPRYLIYSFHMPLFIALTGYLIRPEGLLSLTFPALIRKYFRRLLLPWLLALQIFYLVNHLSSPGEISLASYLSSYWDIYFHLWYIPGLMVWILLSCFLLKLFSAFSAGKSALSIKKNFAHDLFSIRANVHPYFPALLLTALLISLFFCVWYILPLSSPAAERIQYLVYHDFHLLYYIYFVFGMYLRRRPLKRNIRSCGILAAAFFFLYLLLFFHPEQPAIEHAVKFVFNLNLAAFFLSLLSGSAEKGITGMKRIDSRPLLSAICFIGQHSMAYYLYVQLGKSLVLQFVSRKENPLLYGFLLIASSLLLMLLISFLLRYKRFRKYAAGE